MLRHLKAILSALKVSTQSVDQLAQIFAKSITTGLINSIVTWNCIIRAYSKSPTPIKAVFIYNYFIRACSISPDNHTFPALLKSCTRLLSLPKGREIHAHIIKAGLESDIYIQNSLIHFYGAGAMMEEARLVFDLMPQRDLASWNSVLSSYSASPNSWFEALVLFKTMVVNGIGVDGITLAVVLSGCTKVGDTRCGRSIHGYLIKLGIRRNLKLENAVLGMYAKGCDMDSAIQLFHEMVDRRDVASHTILINGYTELGLIDLARCVFDQMPVKDLISWNSMIHGYVKAKRPKDALELFEKMETEFVTPDETTIVSVLSACSSLSELQLGRLVHHRFIMQRNIRIDVFVGTALIDMYAKCGSLEEAVKAFYKMEHKDIFTWTALITGFASYGLGHKALRLFEQMEKEGIEPNETTFVAALTACSRSGLLGEGLLLFGRMVEIYKIQPKIEHFYCLIDLLSRGGLLYQAEEFIEAMATEDRVIAYKTLLSSCMIYSDISLGEKIAEQLVKLGSQNHEVYVLLANFYALTGKWNKAVEIRSIMKEFDMRKKAGISFIQVENIENSQAYESKEMTNYPV